MASKKKAAEPAEEVEPATLPSASTLVLDKNTKRHCLVFGVGDDQIAIVPVDVFPAEYVDENFVAVEM